MLKQEKWHNCGASLTYDERNYNGEVTCQYCRTKYHLDNLGKIEEYKVKLMFLGKVRNFYISEMTQHYLTTGVKRTVNGGIERNILAEPIFDLHLISY